MTIEIGRIALSTKPWRRHAAYIPSVVPRANEMIVVTPIRPSVHGSALRITDETGEGKSRTDVPNRPCAMLFR